MTDNDEVCGADYPLDPTLAAYGASVNMDKRIACRRCPNAEWIVEFADQTYGDDVVARAMCAAHGIQSYPKFRAKACTAREKAIEAERPRADER